MIQIKDEEVYHIESTLGNAITLLLNVLAHPLAHMMLDKDLAKKTVTDALAGRTQIANARRGYPGA